MPGQAQDTSWSDTVIGFMLWKRDADHGIGRASLGLHGVGIKAPLQGTKGQTHLLRPPPTSSFEVIIDWWEDRRKNENQTKKTNGFVQKTIYQAAKKVQILQMRCWGEENKNNIYKLKRDEELFKKTKEK